MFLWIYSLTKNQSAACYIFWTFVAMNREPPLSTRYGQWNEARKRSLSACNKFFMRGTLNSFPRVLFSFLKTFPHDNQKPRLEIRNVEKFTTFLQSLFQNDTVSLFFTMVPIKNVCNRWAFRHPLFPTCTDSQSRAAISNQKRWKFLGIFA
jgi:hypothetical protein